jgi:flagellar secretion chaperone FliS
MKATGSGGFEYLKNAVMTASAEQLHLMLLDGAIRFTMQGRAGLERRDYEASFNAFDRAQKIVLELHAGLRREVNPDLVDRVSAIYDFVFRRLIDANTQHELKAVDDVLTVLKHHRETWQLLIDKLMRANSAPPAPAGPNAAGMSLNA